MMKLISTMVMLGMLAAAAPAFADSCNSLDNIVQNCSFGEGTYASTVGHTNPNTPIGWTANFGFDLEPTYDRVVAPGTLALGNWDYEPVPSLSQALTDIAGATYSGTLYVAYGGAGYGDAGAYFNVLIDGTPVVTLNDNTSNSYTPYTFGFIGTGSDTITLQGNTNPAEWLVQNVSVTDPPTNAPEASSGLLMLVGLLTGGLWLAVQRFNGLAKYKASPIAS